jgi:hypothetical protein
VVGEIALGHQHRQLLELHGGILVVAQLLADHLHLLAEVVLLLALLHVAVHLVLDLARQLGELQLLVDQLQHGLQPRAVAGLLQDLLAVLDAEVEVGTHHVGQLAGILDPVDRLFDVLGKPGTLPAKSSKLRSSSLR